MHGGEPPPVDKELADQIEWDVRVAINEFLAFAADKGFTTRRRVLRALDSDPDAGEIAERFLPDPRQRTQLSHDETLALLSEAVGEPVTVEVEAADGEPTGVMSAHGNLGRSGDGDFTVGTATIKVDGARDAYIGDDLEEGQVGFDLASGVRLVLTRSTVS